jgi:cation-transporting ATPase 13A3/4/5
MITGDNANTAIFIGKQSGMISADEMGRSPIIYLADFVDGKLQWNDIDSKTPHSQSDVEQYIYAARQGGRKVELAVTGKAFNHLNEYFWIQQFLGDIRIFARMTPLDKVKCVRLHMSNHITAMCGDGGNDAGALKAAHAGIALSGSGSSLVSHFSSSNLSILSCVELLKEARCSLDISLASYK